MSNVDYGNPNQRTPCVLVLDASGSMSEAVSSTATRISELNEGLRILESSLREDSTAISRVQLAIVVVGGPSNEAAVMMDWTDADAFSAFPLNADGATPLGAGLQLSLRLVDSAKRSLKSAGISYTRPWIMVISDGAPTDQDHVWQAAIAEAKAAEADKKVEIFSIGVSGADMAKLSEISSRPALSLSGIKFRELFVWLSSSLSAASRSRPGESAALPSTDPWRHVGI